MQEDSTCSEHTNPNSTTSTLTLVTRLPTPIPTPNPTHLPAQQVEEDDTHGPHVLAGAAPLLCIVLRVGQQLWRHEFWGAARHSGGVEEGGKGEVDELDGRVRGSVCVGGKGVLVCMHGWVGVSGWTTEEFDSTGEGCGSDVISKFYGRMHPS